MPPFRAELVFHFEAESIEAAGHELRRLRKAAAEVDFELQTARVDERPPDEPRSGRGTPYAPIDRESA